MYHGLHAEATSPRLVIVAPGVNQIATADDTAAAADEIAKGRQAIGFSRPTARGVFMDHDLPGKTASWATERIPARPISSMHSHSAFMVFLR